MGVGGGGHMFSKANKSMSWEPPVISNFPSTKQGRVLIVSYLKNLSVEENCLPSGYFRPISRVAGIAIFGSLPVQPAGRTVKDIQKEAAVKS